MKNEAKIRQQLIDNATRIIAKGGFEEATTKALVSDGEMKINEAYIYRLYGSKEGLYEAVFTALDDEVFTAFWRRCEKTGGVLSNTRENLYEIFLYAWKFFLQNEAKCRCYVRFYHSVYFRGTVLANHQKTFSRLISKFYPLFKEEADVYSIMHSAFTTLFNFAIRVYNGELPDNDDNREHIFNVVYCMIQTYLKS